MSAAQAYHVRWMVNKDRHSVIMIDDGSFDQPWTDEELLKILRQRDCIGMIAENPDGRVVGFMVYRLHRHHIELLRFAVAPDRRREGVGTVMLAKLTAKLSNVRNRIYIDVPERMLAFQLFLKACDGFLATGVDRGQDGDDDIFTFAYGFRETADAEQGVVA